MYKFPFLLLSVLLLKTLFPFRSQVAHLHHSVKELKDSYLAYRVPFPSFLFFVVDVSHNVSFFLFPRPSILEILETPSCPQRRRRESPLFRPSHSPSSSSNNLPCSNLSSLSNNSLPSPRLGEPVRVFSPLFPSNGIFHSTLQILPFFFFI